MFHEPLSVRRLTVVTALFGLFAIGTTAGAAGQRLAPRAVVAQADSPLAYAEAAFTAWRDGDARTVITRSAPSVAQLLLAQAPGTAAWSASPECEGAAGSTYCTWATDDSVLLLRVANEAAAQGESHAVTEAAVLPPEGGVALWPFTSQEAADNTQRSVDEGHSPWMLDSTAVGSFFASAVFGWGEAVVEALAAPGWFRLADRATGVVVDVEMIQPARAGDGGIWAIARARSAQEGTSMASP